VAALGWTAGHVRVLEAAVSGRLYWRDGRARQAAQPGVWEGGRKVSAERTQALYAARFLSAVRQDDGTRVLIPSPMGQVALELARLHPEGLYLSDKAAYEARYAHAKRKGMSSDEKKAAARRLPPVDAIALRLYRRPVTLAEQEPRAQLESAELWEDEGGYCPGVQTPRPAAGPRVEATQSAAAPDSAASPVADGLECPPGLLVVPLMSTRVRVWWGLECDRCVPGVRAPLPGTWDDKGDACMAARAHSEQVHRPADDTLTADELAELEHAQDGVLQRVLRLLWRGRRQAADRAPKDATPMHPDGRYFQREQRPETAPVPVGSAPAPSALIPPQAEASEDPGRRRASGGPQGQFALF
jgi:hypothetical protein